ncbi:MAG: hypothetical protein QNJ69_05355, partial [Gammaproteobacteria bacterium]|nr:hypothetical protein [Gammaproteobacteria bacterium]
MKNLIRLFAIIGFASISFIAPADSITDTYATGDTLTATTLNNIKSAVNDNDSNITNNTTNITSNTSNISTNSADISSNASGISGNESDISANTADITINAAGISTNAADISANGVEIDVNALDIGTNAANTSANTANISTNTANISTNSSDIFDNTAAIASMFSGDGSAGDLTVSSTVNWSLNPPANPFFNDIVIEFGKILSVPAGTTIYCNSFTNNGLLEVTAGVGIGSVIGIYTTSSPTSGENASAHPGDSFGPASIGHVDNLANNSSSTSIRGGNGGRPIPQAVAISSFGNFKFGGGSGAGYDNQGGYGGGLLRIQCSGNIINAGSIEAIGKNGTNVSIAGGGGGIVILTSLTQVDNSSGTINVSGGGGVTSGNSGWGGNAGGGGGGIVIMASPTAPVPGTEIVAGGLG